MAISVDTIYQRVLALANKEQRGYITPQEYNLLANQAQMSIFESYFYAKNQRERQEDKRNPIVEESDISELLDKKLDPFRSSQAVVAGSTFPSTVVVDGVLVDIFQTGLVFLGDEVCQKVEIEEAQRFKKSTRHISTTSKQNPIYANSRFGNKDIVVYAGSTMAETIGVTVECFRVPVVVGWGYVVVNGKALYNSTAALSVNFELHRSEEDTLVNRILELAGIIINKPGLVQVAANRDAVELSMQKI